MREDNCIFCKIINGDIPSRTIYEDDDFKVIMDADPATKGHSLILPKDHYANLFEMPEDLAAKVLPLAKRLGADMCDKLKCEGMNVVQNNGEVAGQTVHHFHMHLIPRYTDGCKTDVTWSHAGLSDEQLDDICNLLK